MLPTHVHTPRKLLSIQVLPLKSSILSRPSLFVLYIVNVFSNDVSPEFVLIAIVLSNIVLFEFGMTTFVWSKCMLIIPINDLNLLTRKAKC